MTSQISTPPGPPPPMSVDEAKWRLLDQGSGVSMLPRLPNLALPAAGAALLIGYLISSRRRGGIGLLGLGALIANPVVRRAGAMVIGSALRAATSAAGSSGR